MILVLFLKHVEEAMFRIKKRKKKFTNVLNPQSIILDEMFNQIVQINYQINLEPTDDELMRYVSGASPLTGAHLGKGPKSYIYLLMLMPTTGYLFV